MKKITLLCCVLMALSMMAVSARTADIPGPIPAPWVVVADAPLPIPAPWEIADIPGPIPAPWDVADIPGPIPAPWDK